jgi:hypothetical protein|nr:MAG TPA: hypothetical protein [Caudoviricetes sp.]
MTVQFEAKQFIKNKKMFLTKLLRFISSNSEENFDENPYLGQLSELVDSYTERLDLFNDTDFIKLTGDKKLLKGFKAFNFNSHGHYFFEFYEKHGSLIDKIVLYWMVDLKLNPKQCKEYADLFCQHFNKFSHRPLRNVEAQVKYKELLDSFFYDYSGSSC